MNSLIEKMKVLILLLSLTSCCGNRAYKSGDIVMLKPDSIEAVVLNVKCASGYSVRYYDKTGEWWITTVKESELFGNQ